MAFRAAIEVHCWETVVTEGVELKGFLAQWLFLPLFLLYTMAGGGGGGRQRACHL